MICGALLAGLVVWALEDYIPWAAISVFKLAGYGFLALFWALLASGLIWAVFTIIARIS